MVVEMRILMVRQGANVSEQEISRYDGIVVDMGEKAIFVPTDIKKWLKRLGVRHRTRKELNVFRARPHIRSKKFAVVSVFKVDGKWVYSLALNDEKWIRKIAEAGKKGKCKEFNGEEVLGECAIPLEV